jgi:hypothetical protein
MHPGAELKISLSGPMIKNSTVLTNCVDTKYETYRAEIYGNLVLCVSLRQKKIMV